MSCPLAEDGEGEGEEVSCKEFLLKLLVLSLAILEMGDVDCGRGEYG